MTTTFTQDKIQTIIYQLCMDNKEKLIPEIRKIYLDCERDFESNFTASLTVHSSINKASRVEQDSSDLWDTAKDETAKFLGVWIYQQWEDFPNELPDWINQLISTSLSNLNYCILAKELMLAWI